MVCLPKSEGGLRVLNLETHNEVLLLKNLHKFYNRADILWVHLVWEKYYSNGKLPNHTLKGSFWWRDILRLLNLFKGLSSVTPFRGDSCFCGWIFGTFQYPVMTFQSFSHLPKTRT
jgi:hypothetical protein